MIHSTSKFQIGRQGLTEGVIESILLTFKNHKQLRISVLKSSGRDRNSIQKIALAIREKLPFRSNIRIIGFTIVITKLGPIKKIYKGTF